MLSSLLLIAVSSAACPTTFEFHGQPECVELVYDSGRISVTNACTDLLLVDQSLQIHARSTPALGLIRPQTTVEIRDLSAFALGMGGELYKVVAVIAPAPASCAQVP